MKKYRTSISYRPGIKEVEVERESVNSVWIKGNRESKVTTYSAYFDTYKEAKDYVIKHYQDKVTQAKARLFQANELLDLALEL